MAQDDAMAIYFAQNERYWSCGEKTGRRGEEVPGTTLGFHD